MALSEFEKEKCEKLVAQFVERRRPPPHIRPKLDYGFRMQGQSVEIFELRPHFQDSSRILELSFAKATYNRSKQKWKIFWKRADLRWHGYQPNLEVGSIEDFLAVVQKDEYGCFFG